MNAADAALRSQLDANASFDAEYRGGLSNHLPMALQALRAMGADAARIEAFAVGYRGRLAPAMAVADWPEADPLETRLGQVGAWPAYRTLFARRLRRERRDALLAGVLPALMSGCGAAAFHGLIRTAHAVASGHDGELADALAYWACRHLPLMPADARALGDDMEPRVLLFALHAALTDVSLRDGLIFERMREVAAQPPFAEFVGRLSIDATTLPRLATLAAELYVATGDFTVLHLVTASRAMRKLLPFIDAPTQRVALRHFWVAYAAAAGSTRLGPNAAPANAELDWPEIVARACRSDNDHVVKLVHACRSESRAYGREEPWRSAAAQAVA